MDLLEFCCVVFFTFGGVSAGFVLHGGVCLGIVAGFAPLLLVEYQLVAACWVTWFSDLLFGILGFYGSSGVS